MKSIFSFSSGFKYWRLTIAGAVFKVLFGLSLKFELSQPDFVDGGTGGVKVGSETRH